MTKRELYELGFEKAIVQLIDGDNNITTYETLKQFIINNIEQDRIFIARHVLSEIDEDYEYYDYDYTMGTLDKPTPITEIEQLEDYCNEYEYYILAKEKEFGTDDWNEAEAIINEYGKENIQVFDKQNNLINL